MSEGNILIKEKYDKNLLVCILCSLVMAAAIFGYFIYKGKGAFTVVSDFNGQQLTFAAAARHALSANPLGQWVWNLDLGASLINGFGFYNLGSPFFWISILFSKISFPYLAGFLYILKYVVASVTAYFYIKLFVKDSKYAVIGSLLYAFSGFQTTNLMFFHFHDVVAFFPLMLLGLELVIKDKKYMPFFIFAVFLNCIVNYFFFIQEVIFLILYFVIREWDKIRDKFFWKKSVRFMYGGILGVGMAAVLFLPSIIYISGNPRSESSFYLQNLVYDTRNLLFIIKGIIFPGDVMRSQSILLDSNFNSTSCYLPLFGALFAIMYAFKKRDWLRNLLIALSVITIFPMLQLVFVLFKGEFIYQRWWYMLVIVMALATSLVLERIDEYPIVKFASIYAAFIGAFYLAIRYLKFDQAASKIIYHQDRFSFFALIAILGALALMILHLIKQLKFIPVLGLTMACCVLTTFMTLSYYRKGTNTFAYMAQYKTGEKLKTINDQYRYNSANNILTMTGEAGGTGSFSSTVENSSREYDMLFDNYRITETRSAVLYHNYTINTAMSGNSTDDARVLLLGGKYVITQDKNVPNIVKRYESDGEKYYVQEIKACPIGFAVDEYMTKSSLMKLPVEKRALAMMNAAVIDGSDLSYVDDFAKKYDGKVSAKEKYKYVGRTVKERVKNFKRDNTGFSCSTDYKKGKLVWFSVPYDKGWNATLDGKKLEIIKSAGMMAVKVPKGEHDLVFKYHTPGFKLGIIVSIISFIVFGIYTAILVFRKRIN